ncbi:MAG: HDIG domain-containing protein [Clostridia bacterium]|nr:HDIG domain-containing protein [Clostridia bacterium]
MASYFHDIGKVKRPYYFIENQMPADNPHDKIAPTLSTLIITSHVKDGVEMVKEYRFPKAITDIIEQHHGTSLVSFFYHKAKEEGEKPETVLESDFRYQTPKPQTREAAIVTLADSVQAAAHVLQKPTKGHLEAKVREIIRQKLDDGQLSECDLNFKDLDVIAQVFVRVLSGMFHHRIGYPDQMVKEMERGKAKNGNSHKEPTEQDTGKPGNGKITGKSSDGSSASE